MPMTSLAASPREGDGHIKRRTVRACAACRLTKSKCDGKDPCARCHARGLMCMPGVQRRRPARRAGDENESDRETPQKRGPGHRFARKKAPGSKDEANLLNQEVHCSITGSEASVSSTMHLFYGSSSTFVFLQQLHRFLFGKGSLQPTITGKSANYTAEAISEFGYGSIFYGRDADDGIAAGLHDPSTPRKTFEDLSDGLPPFELAATFLEMYLSTVHHVLPFCEPATLRKLFYSHYSMPSVSSRTSRDWTMIMAILAFGATLTYHIDMADYLFQRAESNLKSWGDAVSLRTVQISMLLSEIHQTWGRPNSAVLWGGYTVSKAFAVGLHRDIVSPGAAKDLSDVDRSRAKERQTTFWALYALDRRLSLLLGRPASINDMDIDIPEPAGGTHLEAAVNLARISHKVYYSVYGRKRGSVGEFCKKIQDLRGEFIEYHENLAPAIKFPLSKDQVTDASLNLSASQMILAFDFLHTMLITLRPCLVLDAVRRKSLPKQGEANQVIPSEWICWLDENCKQCSAISIHIIRLFSAAIDNNPFLSCMRHGRFFIEGACFTLLFDVVRDPSSPACEKNLAAVSEGLKCFTRLPSDHLLMISTSAVSRMLSLAQELVSGTPSARSNQPSEPGSRTTAAYDHAELPLQSLPNEKMLLAPTTAFIPNTDGLGSGNFLDDGANGESLGLHSHGFLNNDIFDMSCYLWTEDLAINEAYG
ncbi:uncharacterized protein BP5553_04461 [Venustampulla echinocandica]|uniref:Zn(2)-C6 fungal-type domain-containing protein n=1 Tax=Venustampulla echinocandica TaxID=2656787 RepID=A0A370TND9_9HELO|nr:uncharacterized protein BP5553_04461 [Venustampulla echinocandica]RDL37028.1 hypothetical protein BP5553_04461 [Venustampulla echinocandica]